jgi:hypothetical protein
MVEIDYNFKCPNSYVYLSKCKKWIFLGNMDNKWEISDILSGPDSYEQNLVGWLKSTLRNIKIDKII